MTREIKIFNQESNQAIVLNSEAKTWSELRSEIITNNTINPNDKTPIVRETKLTLSFDDSVLPDGPFTLFLFPKKTKSGVKKQVKIEPLTTKELQEKIKKASILLKKELSNMNISLKQYLDNEIKETKEFVDSLLK
jgi:hypothetical protein